MDWLKAENKSFDLLTSEIVSTLTFHIMSNQIILSKLWGDGKGRSSFQSQISIFSLNFKTNC